MPPTTASALADRLAGAFMVESPQVVGPLAVFPILTDREPSIGYEAFGATDGVTVRELQRGASVNDLEVVNPLDVPVLLYEGQEVLGAQQNRTLDVSVLVAAHSETRVPVTCVEQGRWDGRRHREAFRPAPQAAAPDLRRKKNAAVRASLAFDAEARADQGQVWKEVADLADRHGTASATGAMHDVFDARREQLDAMSLSIDHHCSQVGCLVAIAGRFVVLDWVSDVEAFAALHRPLVQGYALEAVDVVARGRVPSVEDAREFAALLLSAQPAVSPGVALGQNLHYAFSSLTGTGLEYEGELVTLTAFAS